MVSEQSSDSAWLVVGGRDDVEIAVEPASYCDGCGAKTDHVPMTPPIVLGTLPKPGPALWMTADGSLTASPRAADVLSEFGTVDLVELTDTWRMICSAAQVQVSERSIGDACPACGRHDADLVRAPVVIESLPSQGGVVRTTHVFGEGRERSPLWFLMPEAMLRLEANRQPVQAELVRVNRGRA